MNLMLSNAHEYLHLLEQFQMHLMQEHSVGSWLDVNRESYRYYRAFAVSLQKGQQKPVNVQEVPKNAIPNTEVEKIPKNIPQPVEKSPITVAPKTVIQTTNPVPEPDKKSTSLRLEPIGVKETEAFSDIRKILSERFPEKVYLPNPPDDTEAQAIKNSWKNQTSHLYLVVSDAQPRHFSLLANICKAIKIVFNLKAETLDKKQLNDELKVPYLDLGHLDLYLQEPHRKAELWKMICEKIKL